MRAFGGLILLLGCVGATACGGSAARSRQVVVMGGRPSSWSEHAATVLLQATERAPDRRHEG